MEYREFRIWDGLEMSGLRLLKLGVSMTMNEMGREHVNQ